MGYKYRNDGTPDHVDSSQSDTDYPHVGIPITASDTTKRVPVDTVKLKDRIDATKSNKDFNDYLSKNPNDSPGDRKISSDMATQDNNRLKAQQDTLDKARKGKIPAKP